MKIPGAPSPAPMSLCARAREAEAGKDQTEEGGGKQITNTKPQSCWDCAAQSRHCCPEPAAADSQRHVPSCPCSTTSPGTATSLLAPLCSGPICSHTSVPLQHASLGRASPAVEQHPQPLSPGLLLCTRRCLAAEAGSFSRSERMELQTAVPGVPVPARRRGLCAAPACATVRAAGRGSAALALARCSLSKPVRHLLAR